MTLRGSSMISSARTEEARKRFRYVGVPVVFVVLGQVFGLWFQYTLASLVAATVVLIPNFFASRHFVWRMTARDNPRHSALAFWSALMLSVSLATLFTYFVDSETADQTMPIRSAAVLAAQ